MSAPHYAADGPDLRCAFETYWCRARASLAGGLDEHHELPKSLGGAESGRLLLLCPLHHRRQHALIRAMIEAGNTDIRTIRYFSVIERQTAAHAVAQWRTSGSPKIDGWPSPAAALQ